MTLTQERAKELLPVIAAVAEGKKLQCRAKGHEEKWHDCYNGEIFIDTYDYRIKPEPRRVELCENIHGVLLRGVGGQSYITHDNSEANPHRKVTFVEVLE